MHLWTDYEGNVLSGYTVGRLTRSEGRSAFFLTVDESDSCALLRLTETHFDEGELVARWQKAAAVDHPNLQVIRNSGKATFDGTALACCLLECTNGSLADVLRDRVLSTEEALEVAEAVAGAIAALHAAGLIHEHLDATNVFAVGEAIKLRSDCVRECVGDFEADTEEARSALRARDVNDLGLLLRRCLTPQWQESAEAKLPAPFHSLVHRCLHGTITAQQIVAEMQARRPAPLPSSVAQPAPAVPSTASAPNAATQTHAPAPAVLASGVAAAPSPSAALPLAAASAPQSIYAGLPSPYAQQAATAATRTPDRAEPAFRRKQDVVRRRHIAGADAEELLPGLSARAFLQSRAGLAVAAAVLLLAVALWATLRAHHPASDASESPAATHSVHPSPGAPLVVLKSPAPVPSAGLSHPKDDLLRSGEQAGWRVIVYTYNYEQQAAAKAAQLQRRYLALHPQVFTPSGHAPYFVALGGFSDAVSAIALRNRARHSGLPRDTFARNF